MQNTDHYLDKNTRIYMIRLQNNPISQHYVNVCKPTWEAFGYNNIWLFDGITPETIEERCPIKLKFGKKTSGWTGKKNRPFTPTEIAVWYSHYYLWRRIRRLGRPAIVIEHDNALTEDIPNPIEMYNLRAFCRHERKPVLMAGSAYYVTPEGCDTLIKDKKLDNIKQNVDGHLLQQPNQTPFKDDIDTNTYATVVYDAAIGTTIDHGNR